MKRLLARPDLWYSLAVASCVIYEGATFVAPVDAWPARLFPAVVVILIWQLLTWQRLARHWREVSQGWEQCADAWRDVAWKAYARRAESLDWWERIMREGEHR